MYTNIGKKCLKYIVNKHYPDVPVAELFNPSHRSINTDDSI